MTTSSTAIERYLTYAEAGGLSDRTRARRGGVLRRFDAAYGLLGSTAEELAAWLTAGHTAAGEPWSRQTKASYYGDFNAFYEWALSAGLVDDNPALALIRPKVPTGVPRPVDTELVRDVLARAANPWRRHVLLASYAGLRCCEIMTIRREDITADHLIVRGKGGKLRVIPTHQLIWDDVRGLPPGPISPRPAWCTDEDDWISNRTAAYLRNLGYDGVAMHRFRHWFGSETYRATKDLRAVQQLLGHASPTTTAVYTLIHDEERRAAISALPALADASTPAAS